MEHAATTLLMLLVMLQVKHLIVDWCWQPPYEWQNKGTYLHFGGIRHALKNSVGTAACFLPFFPITVAATVLIMDFLAHYHVDWAKMNINRIKGWGATTHPQFWALTGLDQFLHQLTYIVLIWWAIS